MLIEKTIIIVHLYSHASKPQIWTSLPFNILKLITTFPLVTHIWPSYCTFPSHLSLLSVHLTYLSHLWSLLLYLSLTPVPHLCPSYLSLIPAPLSVPFPCTCTSYLSILPVSHHCLLHTMNKYPGITSIDHSYTMEQRTAKGSGRFDTRC